MSTSAIKKAAELGLQLRHSKLSLIDKLILEFLHEDQTETTHLISMAIQQGMDEVTKLLKDSTKEFEKIIKDKDAEIAKLNVELTKRGEVNALLREQLKKRVEPVEADGNTTVTTASST